jgi:pimeloyl-ACP methyl ester carboxylesterase
LTANQSPTLVFVHGAGSNADFWHWQRDAFLNAIYLNLPGHSQRAVVEQTSNPKSEIPNLKLIGAYADWVERYIQAEGLSNVVLNGHSMGGAITLTLALSQPNWLKGIVLTGTGARLRVLPRLIELLRTDYQAAVDLIVQESFAPPSGPLTYGQRARLNGTRRQLLRTRQAVASSDYEACNDFDVMDRVGEISLPTLCIVGAQDRMTPPKYSEYLHSKLAGSRLEVIEGAGHMLPMEQPEEYNRRLADFISSLKIES